MKIRWFVELIHSIRQQVFCLLYYPSFSQFFPHTMWKSWSQSGTWICSYCWCLVIWMCTYFYFLAALKDMIGCGDILPASYNFFTQKRFGLTMRMKWGWKLDLQYQSLKARMRRVARYYNFCRYKTVINRVFPGVTALTALTITINITTLGTRLIYFDFCQVILLRLIHQDQGEE